MVRTNMEKQLQHDMTIQCGHLFFFEPLKQSVGNFPSRYKQL